MAKPGGFNEEVLQGIELAGGLVHGVVSVDTTRSALRAVATDIKWVFVQNISAVVIYVGSSTVTNSGATRGIQIRPNATITLNIDDLSKVFVIAASGSGNEVLYLAGTPGA